MIKQDRILKQDKLFRAILNNQEILLTFLKKMKLEDDDEDEEEDEDNRLVNSMVKAIKSTRSPHRTIASNY